MVLFLIVWAALLGLVVIEGIQQELNDREVL